MRSSRKAICLLQEELRSRMNSRQVEDAIRLIEERRRTLSSLIPEETDTPGLFFILSRCIEDSPTALAAVRSLARKYQKRRWPRISLADWVLVMAGRVRLAFYDHDDHEVDRLWQWIISSTPYVPVPLEVLGAIHLTASRSQKRRGAFPAALELTEKAVSAYLQAKLPFMAAIAQVNQGWLLDQLGQAQKAATVRAVAFKVLKDTQDWTNLGNISFGHARAQMHVDGDQLVEALSSCENAATYYRRSSYAHRNLRRTLLGLAELQLRFARAVPEKRAEWIQAADRSINEVRQLMKTDPGDFRNTARSLLVDANRALIIPNLHRARTLAQAAYDYAEEHSDSVMMARARLRQAGVEYFAMGYEQEIQPTFAVQRSLDYAKKALPLGEMTHNFRLLVRSYTLIGHLHLVESPYHNIPLAEHHCSEAQGIVSMHEGMGHLTDGVASLHRKLESMRNPKDGSPIAVITSRHLERPLDDTIQRLEVAVVSAAQERFGDSDVILSKLLGVGHGRVARILGGKGSQNERFSCEIGPGQYVIYRVTFALILTEGLENIVQSVEHEIIRAAMEKHHYNDWAVRHSLNIGHDRYNRHASLLKKKLRASAATP